jgi:hypothetical protein
MKLNTKKFKNTSENLSLKSRQFIKPRQSLKSRQFLKSRQSLKSIKLHSFSPLLNKELQERIEKHQLHIETLIEINEKYSDTIGKLRARLKELIVKS